MHFSNTRQILILLVTLSFLLPTKLESATTGESLPTSIVARDPLAWDPALAVSASQTIKRHRQKQGVILVDVRSAADWSIARIPGAMHIPLAFVGSKAFLKGRSIVLVGSGHDSVALMEACRDLNRKGFKACLLAGGIQAWLAADGPLTGNPAALIPQREMRPEAFFREKNIVERPVLFVADGDARTEMDVVIPYALKISLQAKPEEIKKIIGAVLKISLGGKSLPLLVCTPDGRDHDRITAKLAQAGVSPALFLEGGLAAYRTYLFGILQAWRRQEDRVKIVGGCRGCGQVGKGDEAVLTNK